MRKILLTDSLKEAITMSEAAAEIPGRPNAQTVWRWSTKGVRGHVLSTFYVGGRRLTTKAAIEEFLQRLNAGMPAAQDAQDAEMAQLGRESSRALEALGI